MPSETFCSGLANGSTAEQLWDGYFEVWEFANQAYDRMSSDCPEHLERHRAFFDNWGIDIDA